MGWFNPAPGLSEAAKTVFEELVSACSSEASGVVECLNTIAENGGEQATDAFLRGCAEEMRDYCERVITALGQAPLTRPISELGLMVRSRKCMIRLGINTWGELCQRTADDLCECRNFGITSLNEIREKLADRGLYLRGEGPPAKEPPCP